MMKNIYVIFSATDLKIGKMIRAVTRNSYNHCSICLRDDLSQFYSFSRVYRSNPLIGGFVTESPCRYTLSSRTGLKIVRVPVTEDIFGRVVQLIHYMREHGDEYVYNYFSAVTYPLGMKYKSRNAFTCAEFTREVLKTAGIDMPEQANIYKMESALCNYQTTEGRAVDILGSCVWGEDRYLEHIGKKKQAVQIAKRFGRLLVGARVSPPGG